MAEVGWELSDSDNDEDIFEIKLAAPIVDDEGEPGAPPTTSSHVNSSVEGKPPIPHQQQAERPPGEKPTPKNGFGNGKLPYTPPRNGRPMNDRSRFGRRGEDNDRHPVDRFDPGSDDGFDPSRYSMAFPKSPPFCAWFGNVTLDTEGNDLEEELYGYFSQLDLEPKEIRFGNRGQSSNKTCCFVDFDNGDDLRHALTQIDREAAPRFYNYKLLVDIAEPRSSGSRFGGRGKRRGGRHGPISVGNDEYHPHVNPRSRRPRGLDSPSRGRGDFNNRRRGSGHRGPERGNGFSDRRINQNPRNGGTPRRLSRNTSNGSSIHDDQEEMSFERRRSDRDSHKTNVSIRDTYERSHGVRSVRPSGPSRHRPRQDFDEPRQVRTNPRRERRAKPRENFKHTKHGPVGSAGGRAPKSRGGGSRAKTPRGNSRFSQMFG